MEKGKGFTHANRLFWSLNGKLTEEGVRDRIKDFQEKGFGGFFLHARAGLRTEYFSEEWFSLLAVAVDEAEKRGMEAWLYDEDGWPSGFGGGRINRKGVDYCQKYLVAEVEIPGALRGVPCEWEPVLGNLRVGPCAGKQGRAGRKWSLPQPVARILLCGTLPELKVKNLLLQCTYNGAGRDFLSHFNRNPA